MSGPRRTLANFLLASGPLESSPRLMGARQQGRSGSYQELYQIALEKFW